MFPSTGKLAPPPPPVPPRTSERAVLPQEIMDGPPQQHIDQWVPMSTNGLRPPSAEFLRNKEARERAHIPVEEPSVNVANFNPEDIQNSLSRMREVFLLFRRYTHIATNDICGIGYACKSGNKGQCFRL